VNAARRTSARREALSAWDSQIAEAYLARASPRPPLALSGCEITLQRTHARALVLVVADVAVRMSTELGQELAHLDNRIMRDAAIGVGVERYVTVLRTSRHPPAVTTIAERILSGLVVRRVPELHSALLTLTVELPPRARDELDAELNRVLSQTDLTDLGGWHGDLTADLRSSVVEAIVAEWMHARADAFGITQGLDPSKHIQPARTLPRSRGRSH
jgi:hypothetical protein